MKKDDQNDFVRFFVRFLYALRIGEIVVDDSETIC